MCLVSIVLAATFRLVLVRSLPFVIDVVLLWYLNSVVTIQTSYSAYFRELRCIFHISMLEWKED